MTTQPGGSGGGAGEYQAVFEASPEALLVHDADGTITKANQRAEAVLGLDRADIVGRRYDDLAFDLHSEKGDPLPTEELPFARVRTAGEPVTDQIVSVETEATRRMLSVSGQPLFDESGAFDGAVVSIDDVTEQHRTELAMRERREHLETVVENLPVILFALDPDGTFTISRGSALETLGLEPGEAVGSTIDEMYADYPDVLDSAKRALAGEDVRTTAELGAVTFDTWYRPLVDDAGDVQQVLGVSFDVTNRRERERALQDREQQLSKIIESTNDAVMIKNADGEYELINEAGAAYFGRDADEIIGKTDDELFEPEVASTLRAHDEAVMDAGEQRQYDERIGIDGEEYVFESNRVPYTDADGSVVGTITISRDVTERKKRERRLEENDAILRQLTGTADEVFWLFDSDFTEVQFVNDAYEEIWGRSVAELRENAMDFMEGVHPEDRETVANAVQRLGNGETTHEEYRVNPEEEFGRWVSVRGEPIYDDEGAVVRAAGLARDITERKEREQQLQALSEATEELSYARTPDEVAETAVDIAGRILDQPLTAVWRYEAETDRLVPWAASDRAQGLASSSGGVGPIPPDSAEMAAFRDGEPTLIDDYSAIDDPGHPETPLGSLLLIPLGEHGLLTVGTDEVAPFTAPERNLLSILASNATAAFQRADREQALETYKDKLEESNENLQEFAYIASHDLQEPLRSVTSYLDLLATEYGDELEGEGEFYIERAESNASRMSAMIDALLAYSRVKTEGGTFDTVAAETVVAETLDSLGVLINESEARIRTGSLPTVTADENQLGQVFQNLLKNAIEHGGEPPEIEITATDAGDAWEFAVADNGPGVPEPQQDRIFEIFQQGNTDGDGEAGIGLAICERIVSRHRGDIWVDADGSGSTFKFTLPKGTSESEATTGAYR